VHCTQIISPKTIDISIEVGYHFQKALPSKMWQGDHTIMKKVVKFGGSSLASAKQFKKVGDIIRL